MKNWFLSLIIVLCSFPALATINFEAEPVWQSDDNLVSTGLAIGDINSDGIADLAVSNGNDINPEPEVVYFGKDTGLSSTPEWISDDLDYSGHCVLGDLDGDQFPEFIVGNYIENTSGFTPSITKIYYNLGGNLETTPSWVSVDLNNTFSVTLGDVDGDGDLDLATANGESYFGAPQANEIYLNSNGIIEQSPFWISQDLDHSYDLEFCDFDKDGDLDLAVANSKSPSRLYLNNGETLEQTASWSASEPDSDNSLTWGDINSDGWQDLIIVSNAQLNVGSGLIKIHFNQSGNLESVPSIVRVVPGNGFGSGVCADDFDMDGDTDLATGRWWGHVLIWENSGTELSENAAWSSSNSFVIEAIEVYPSFLSETDNILSLTLNSESRIIEIPNKSATNVKVQLDGQPLDPALYCVDPKGHWISLSSSIQTGSKISLSYPETASKSLVATSWGAGQAGGANFGYLNNHSEPTPTPTPLNRSLSIQLNKTNFTGGDPFNCSVKITNPMPEITTELYVLLEVEGQFFFYPSWNTSLDSEVIDIDPYSSTSLEIFAFTFPDTIGYNGNLSIYTAGFEPGTFIFNFDLDSVNFAIGD